MCDQQLGWQLKWFSLLQNDAFEHTYSRFESEFWPIFSVKHFAISKFKSLDKKRNISPGFFPKHF